MATPIPYPAAAAETGLPESTWITDVRADLRDQPIWVVNSWTGDGVTGVNAANSIPFRIERTPVYDGSVRVSVGGVAQTVISTGAPTTGQALVNYDTGDVTFGTAPGNGVTVNYSYQVVRWRDSTILTQLEAGLRAMFPIAGKSYLDTSILTAPLTWDYQLPAWLQDPRSQILGVEIQEAGISVNPFKPVETWDRKGNYLHFPTSQAHVPNSILRISGWGPYLRLGDMEPQLYHLPLLYACGQLLLKAEATRSRDDRLVPATMEAAHIPGAAIQTAQAFMRAFDEELNRMRRLNGPGWNKRLVTTYERNRYGY